MYTFPNVTPKIFLRGDGGSAMRGKWWKNNAGRLHKWRGGNAASDQVPVCWSLGCSWTSLYTRVYTYIHVYAHTYMQLYTYMDLNRASLIHTHVFDHMHAHVRLAQVSICAGPAGNVTIA